MPRFMHTNRLSVIRLIKTFLVILLILILPAATPAQAPEEAKTVDATGYGSISNGNAALARDAAVADALRQAVEQAIGTMISSETMVENFQVLSDNVYTKSQGYVKSYNVVRESETSNMYQVTVRAVVSVGSIKNDLDALGLLQVKAEKPRVLFMIAEQNVGDRYFTFWWLGKPEAVGETTDLSAAQTSLQEIFLDKGFNVVDISGSTGSISVSNAYRVADLSNEGARTIGRKLNAEVVIKGKAIAKEGPRTAGSQVAPYIADITAQAIRVDTGEVLASSKGHAVARNISDTAGGADALSRASSELADKMIEQIAAKWSKGNSVIVRISGITDYRQVADYKNLIKRQIRGVQAIYQRTFEGGLAVFELETKTPTQAIADEMAGLADNPFRITNTTSNSIDAAVNQE